MKKLLLIALLMPRLCVGGECDEALHLCDELQKQQDKSIVMLKVRNAQLEDEVVSLQSQANVNKITYFLAGVALVTAVIMVSGRR